MDEIIFKKIKNDDIFREEFSHLNETEHGKITFSSNGIAVLYAPNGTGKSSLAKVLSQTQSNDKIDFEAVYNGNETNPSNNIFHIIGDQISRNIIHGDTSDFLIGRDIKREYELINIVDKGFTTFYETFLNILKTKYKVSKKGDFFVNSVRSIDDTAGSFIESIVNRSKKGRDINHDAFVNFVSNEFLPCTTLDDNEEKRSFIISDCSGNQIANLLIHIDLNQMQSSKEVRQIEQNEDAIFIAKKYSNLSECIVCDNKDFNANNIITKKENNKKRIYDNLNPETKEFFGYILSNDYLKQSDPFAIKEVVLDFIENGTREKIERLKSDLSNAIDCIAKNIIFELKKSFDDMHILESYQELKALQQTNPQIDEEDLLFIKEIVNNNIEQNITIEREANGKNFKLLLEGKDFLGIDRKELHLSTGEQNFISLSFEFLLARNSDKEIIVLDDPISSFDSVYKNKIAFCIIKFLEKKKQLILTHNTDLIKLLEFQCRNCFNLYLFNNVENGENGFIPICKDEKEILLNLHKLLKVFRNEDDVLKNNIIDKRLFLMSMIPFMRGYAHILSNGNEIYCKLSELMHGYTNASENVSAIYKSLFNYEIDEITVSTADIIGLDCSNLLFFNREHFPLLTETLRQTLIYYHLRMLVEKTLVDHFRLNIRGDKQLTDIINMAFPRQATTNTNFQRIKENRVFFTSRKTLVNEFNHFEGNMNIFQPAIDISKQALDKEVQAIKEKLQQL